MDAPVTTPIRVGIAGAGFAAASHLDALRRLENVQIAGLLASSPERTQAAAERLRGPPARPLAQPPHDGVVHNCTPNDVHASITTAALDAGVHVLSEKPLGFDASEATTRARAPGEAGVP